MKKLEKSKYGITGDSKTDILEGIWKYLNDSRVSAIYLQKVGDNFPNYLINAEVEVSLGHYDIEKYIDENK